MKRSPLNRKVGLVRKTFDKLATGSELRRSPLQRRGRLKAKAPAVDANEVKYRTIFNQSVLVEKGPNGAWRRARCIVCGKLGQQAHHVVPKQKIKAKYGHLPSEERWALIFDPADGVPVCADCHERHENASVRIPFERLPRHALVFAEHYGFMPYVERIYPRTSTKPRDGGREE